MTLKISPLIWKRAFCVRFITLAALTILASATVDAQTRPPEQIAAQVPTIVTEVHTGGGWQSGADRGVYRALVIPDAGDGSARVVIQWIAVKDDASEPRVVNAVAIKQVADKKLPNAFLTIEAEREGEFTVIVASFDPATNKDTALAFKAGSPGTYAPTAVPEGIGPATASKP